MAVIIGLDPGPYRSALVVYDGSRICEHCQAHNLNIVEWLIVHGADRTYHGGTVGDGDTATLVIEQIAAMGMAVGAEVFMTAHWDGRFTQAWTQPVEHLKRHEIKMHLCGSMRAKDPNIRAALIDKFGGAEWAIGTKKAPGPLYGLHGDAWSALAVATTWYDLHVAKPMAAAEA